MGGGGWDSPSPRADKAEGPGPPPGPACPPSSDVPSPLLPFPFLLKKFFFDFFLKIIYFWLHWVLLLWWAFSGGHSSGAVRGLLPAVRHALVAERGLAGTQASAAAYRGVSCPAARGIFPDAGSNPCPRFIGRWILNHWTTGEVLFLLFKWGRDRQWLTYCILWVENLCILLTNLIPAKTPHCRWWNRCEECEHLAPGHRGHGRQDRDFHTGHLTSKPVL